jgi:hypothetical protein
MIYCTILTGTDANPNPAETFIAATVRSVCLPDTKDALLGVSVSRTAFMQVLIDEEVVLAVEVTPDVKHFKLEPLLTRKPRETRPLGRLPLPRIRIEDDDESGPAREFTVVFRDGGPQGHVVATYDFQILEPRSWDSRYSQHFDLVEGTKNPVVFTRDARCAEKALNCWNCDSPVKPGDICKNCGCCQDGHENE